jgi:hypothetical protein
VNGLEARSTFLPAPAQIMHIDKRGLFTENEFAGFSEEIRGLVLDIAAL